MTHNNKEINCNCFSASSNFLWPRRHTIYLLIEVTAVWVAHIVRVQHRTTIIVGIYCTSKRDPRVVGVGMVRMMVVIIIVVVVLAVVVIRRQEHVSGFSKSFRVFTVRLPVSSCCQTTDDYNDFVQLERNNTLAKCSQGWRTRIEGERDCAGAEGGNFCWKLRWTKKLIEWCSLINWEKICSTLKDSEYSTNPWASGWGCQ